ATTAENRQLAKDASPGERLSFLSFGKRGELGILLARQRRLHPANPDAIAFADVRVQLRNQIVDFDANGIVRPGLEQRHFTIRSANDNARMMRVGRSGEVMADSHDL